MDSQTNSSGIGCAGVLFIITVVLVVLQLAGVIAWSWWIVLLPLIIAGVLVFLTFGILILLAIFDD